MAAKCGIITRMNGIAIKLRLYRPVGCFSAALRLHPVAAAAREVVPPAGRSQVVQVSDLVGVQAGLPRCFGPFLLAKGRMPGRLIIPAGTCLFAAAAAASLHGFRLLLVHRILFSVTGIRMMPACAGHPAAMKSPAP